MTGLLTAAAIVTTIILLVSASNTGSNATSSDKFSRGTWGIASWTSNRNRPLDPHERRWQTAMLSGRDNDSRWRDLVSEIQTLEYLAGVAGQGPAPGSYDTSWIDSNIADLESVMATKDIPHIVSGEAGKPANDDPTPLKAGEQ